MSDATRILSAMESGDQLAAEQLMPLVYEELRRLAGQKLAHETPGLTLTATALVHEAYVRLVDVNQAQRWDSRGHFFAAAAEAMRRILVEGARRKRGLKHGGDRAREELDISLVGAPKISEDLLALDEALSNLAKTDKTAADIVNLRYFAGLTRQETADVLGVSERTADRIWAFARAWLLKALQEHS